MIAAEQVQEMFDVSSSLATTEEVQHPELSRVLGWSFKSLLFAALVLAMLPGGVVSIASLYPTNMHAPTLAVASL